MSDVNWQWPQWIATSIISLVLAIVLSSFRNRQNKHSSRIEASNVPMLPGSFVEFIQKFVSSKGPQLVLQMTKDMNSLVFQAPTTILLPNGFYILGDHAAARRALEDPTSRKWEEGNQFFTDTTNGINFIVAQDERWKHVRKSTSAAFSGPNIRRMVQNTFHSVIEKWIQANLEPAVKNQTPIDILHEMNVITSNIICEAAFDYTLSDMERTRMLDNLRLCWLEFGQKPAGNPLRTFTITRWAYPGIRAGRRAAKELYNFCKIMLEQYRAKENKKPYTIIHMIISDNDYTNDAERIRDLVAFVIAGFDTTANTLSFCLRELAMNKGEQTKLRQAIRATGKESDGSVSSAVKNAVKETLRMYPAAAAGSVRQLGKDLKIESNNNKKEAMVIPEKALVLLPYYVMQRNGHVFNNPDTFDPSRWINATPETTRGYMTFSSGKRNCQGQALAYAEMHEVITRLICDYEFDIIEAGEAENLVLYKPTGTLLSARKLKVS